MFCSLDLNRKNINRAISDNMLKDLSMLPDYLRLSFNTDKSRDEYERFQLWPNSKRQQRTIS
jgi:hypothetical protein